MEHKSVAEDRVMGGTDQSKQSSLAKWTVRAVRMIKFKYRQILFKYGGKTDMIG